jgi:branched-chain amino acid transport system permease protein
VFSRAPTSYRQSLRLVSSRSRLGWLALLVAALLYLPTVLNEQTFLGYALTNTQLLGISLSTVNATLIAVMGAVTLNLLVGYTGLISLGHAAFFIVGAVVAAQLGVKGGMSLPVVLIVGAVTGALIGFLIGITSLRLRGLYLLLSTMALHFVTIYLFLQYQIHEFEAVGIFYDEPKIGPIVIDSETSWYFLLVVAAAVMLLLSRNVLAMREGRAFLAVRDHDIAAASLGMNVPAVKLRAFALSSAMVTCAGVFYAYNLTALTAESFSLGFVIAFYAMIIIGGMASLLGAVLGAALWTMAPRVLETLSAEVPPDAFLIGEAFDKYQAQLVQVMLGAVVIAILLFRPAGLAGVWQSTKQAVRRWPYTT